MVRRDKTRVSYSQKQENIIREILSQVNCQTIDFSQIKTQYNSKCFRQIEGFVPKSYKALKNKIKGQLKLNNHYWSNQLNQKMLDCVSIGLQWKEISLLPSFYRHGLTRKDIKNKFQCETRFKFGVIYRKVYKCSPPIISDLTFKALLNKQSILSYYLQNLISCEQKDCLLDNIQVFKTNSNQEQSRIARNYFAKQKILNLVSVSTSRKFLVDTIVKLNKKRNIEKLISLNRIKVFYFSRQSKQNLDSQSNEQRWSNPLRSMMSCPRGKLMNSEVKNEENLRNLTLIESQFQKPLQFRQHQFSEEAFSRI